MSEVFRVEKTDNYTVMSNYHLRDKRLTLKAKGLLCYILSLPDDWDYTLDGLKAKHPDGKTAIRSCLNNLEKAGYLRRRQTISSNGQFSKNEYLVYEKPISESPSSGFPTTVNPTTDNPSTEKPTSENQTQQNTYIQNTNQQNTYSTNYPSTKQDGLRESRRACEEKLKEKFEFDLLVENGWDANRLTEVIRIMANVFCSTKPFFVINGENIPRDDVIDRLLLIDENHISYAFEVVDEKKGEIYNIKDYYLSVLFNAPMTMDSYITEKLQRLGVI